MNRWLSILAVSTVAACSAPTSQPPGTYQPSRVNGAIKVGTPDANQVIDLIIGLKRRPGADVDAFLKRAGVSEPFLSPAEFADRFGPTAVDYAVAVSWLQSRGLEIVDQAPSRTTISVRGSVAHVEDAFHTRLAIYQDHFGQFRAPVVEPYIDLGTVAIVGGLDSAQRFFSHRLQPPPGNDAGGGSLGPSDIRALYGADKTDDGTVNHAPLMGDGETVAILTSGYPPGYQGAGQPVDPASDLAPFIKRFSLPTQLAAQYTQIFLGGANQDADTEASNAYGENLLDIDMAMGVAQKASIVHVFASTVGWMFENGMPYIMNYVPQAHAVSVSWGICDRFESSQATLYSLLMQQAKAQGQQWFISAGDDGSDGCGDYDPGAALVADFPASVPYVIGVGGTQITKSVEVPWNEGCMKCEGGGGQSGIYDKPDYQTGVGPYPDDGARDVPDVAAIAGAPYVTIVYSGGVSSSGGTSASAPIWAALWSLLDQSQGGHGFRDAHERLYKLGKAGVGFHDVVTGDNTAFIPGFPAGPGFDLVTGWGTPDMPNLIAHWND